MNSKAETKDKGPSAFQDFLMRMGILGELLAFLWKRKLYWLLPLVITLIVFGMLLVIGSSSPVGVFIYPLL